MKSILFSLTLVFTALACFAQDYYGNNRKQCMDAFERAWRERTGRIGCELAKQAEAVYRVTCGIGTRIK